MKRGEIKKVEPRFLQAEGRPELFSSGCAVLDCVLGGGYPLGRIVNVVGDKSTGKTLLAIEACANFAAEHPEGLIWYNEVEAAFDRKYASTLGLPVEKVNFAQDCFTVEQFFDHLKAAAAEAREKNLPGLYILDSLDALSDKAELESEIDKGSYGAQKAKKLSELFRRLVQQLQKSRITLVVISQVRDKIGVMFGEKTTRSGGRALDFYASQVLFLAQIETLKKAVKGVERPIGVRIKAKCRKNKIGPPLRECLFDLRFGFGMDDVAANLNWLAEVDMSDRVGVAKDKVTRWLREFEKMEPAEQKAKRTEIAAALITAWAEVEGEFLPKRRKY